uniref:Uncharacterized protein n=1 Tax=Ditylenchus dipsaci TaxID=166011 RepID=A0A915EKL0_9BILA
MDVLLGLGVRAKKAIRFNGETLFVVATRKAKSKYVKSLLLSNQSSISFGQDLRPKKQRAPAMSNLQVEIEEYFDQLAA